MFGSFQDVASNGLSQETLDMLRYLAGAPVYTDFITKPYVPHEPPDWAMECIVFPALMGEYGRVMP